MGTAAVVGTKATLAVCCPADDSWMVLIGLPAAAAVCMTAFLSPLAVYSGFSCGGLAMSMWSAKMGRAAELS